MSKLPSYFCGSAEAVIVLSYRAPQHCHLPARGRLPGSHCIVLLDCLSRRDAQLFNVARSWVYTAVGVQILGCAVRAAEHIPVSQAPLDLVTHALSYGTGCFEGIRGYCAGCSHELGNNANLRTDFPNICTLEIRYQPTAILESRSIASSLHIHRARCSFCLF